MSTVVKTEPGTGYTRKRPRTEALQSFPIRSKRYFVKRRMYKAIRRFIKKQLAWFDKDISGTVSKLTGVFNILNDMSAGAAEGNRLGNSVQNYSLLVQGNFFNYATAPMRVRVIFFIDRQHNGSAPATTDLLTTATIGGFKNLNNSMRFQILSDKRYDLGEDEEAGYNLEINEYFRIPVRTNYLGGGTGAASVGANAIYMYFMHDGGTTTIPEDNPLDYAIRTRLRYEA